MSAWASRERAAAAVDDTEGRALGAIRTSPVSEGMRERKRQREREKKRQRATLVSAGALPVSV